MVTGNEFEVAETVEPEYLSPKELAKKFNLSLKSIKKWTQQRRIPGQLKCGARWRYNRLAIEKAILGGELLKIAEGGCGPREPKRLYLKRTRMLRRMNP